MIFLAFFLTKLSLLFRKKWNFENYYFLPTFQKCSKIQKTTQNFEEIGRKINQCRGKITFSVSKLFLLSGSTKCARFWARAGRNLDEKSAAAAGVPHDVTVGHCTQKPFHGSATWGLPTGVHLSVGTSQWRRCRTPKLWHLSVSWLPAGAHLVIRSAQWRHCRPWKL